mgnify:CR=1 FL=1
MFFHVLLAVAQVCSPVTAELFASVLDERSLSEVGSPNETCSSETIWSALAAQ